MINNNTMIPMTLNDIPMFQQRLIRWRATLATFILLLLSLTSFAKTDVGCEVDGEESVSRYSTETYTLEGTTCVAAASWTTTCGVVVVGSETSSSVQIHFNGTSCSTALIKALNSSGGTIASLSVTISYVPPFSSGTITNATQTADYNTTPDQLTATAAAGGGCSSFDYQWYSSVNNVDFTLITGATSQNYQPGSLAQTTYYKRRVICDNVQQLYTNTAVVTVYPPLVAGTISPSTQTLDYETVAAMLSVSGVTGGTGTYLYQWQSSTNNTFWLDLPGENSTTLSPGVMLRTRKFRLKVTSGSVTMVTIPGEVIVRSQLNYVRTTEMLRAGYNETNIDSLTFPNYTRSTQYFDGLGRPAGTTSEKASPDQLDINQFTGYDAFGRELIKYLPYVQGNSGNYKFDFKTTDKTDYATMANPQYYFYQGNAMIADDQHPFAESRVEDSPLGRVIKQGSPGTAWQPDEINTYNSSDRTVRFSYGFNGVDEVRRWSAQSSGIVVADSSGIKLYYTAGSLYKTRTRDEHGNEVIEYTDMTGNILLKRVQAVSGASVVNDENYASTYYIYDDIGNLICVIPPEASKLISQTSSAYFGKLDAEKESFLKRWAFRYTYDVQNRMITKQVPGAEPVYMVYDELDRLILTQDGNQRAATPKTWTFTKYDLLNRPVATGIKDTTATLTQAQMQGVVDHYYSTSLSTLGETFVGYAAAGNLHGYSNTSYPIIHTAATASENAFLTVTYYDNYNYRSAWLTSLDNYSYLDENLSKTANGIQYDQPDAHNPNVIGQVTGSKVKVLDGGPGNVFTWRRPRITTTINIV